MRLTGLTILALLFLVPLQAQNVKKAFILGENEEAYEKLSREHARTLLAVSNNDPEEALGNWFETMRGIERYANSIDFDIKGLKALLHIFWNEDGTIGHIGYFILPDSRNYPPEDLSALLASFVRQHTSELTSDRKFSHYTNVSFPTFVESSKN
ncbi:MAG: hypothetical protein HRU40_03840 [Saprospiraceae bacterium]|nr:hypothetical protein [Saprospiraceae bacterium]